MRELLQMYPDLADAQSHLDVLSLQRAADVVERGNIPSPRLVADLEAMRGASPMDDVDELLSQRFFNAAILVALVARPQIAGLVEGDLEAYMQQWTDDARIVNARGPVPGPHDLALSRAQIRATRAIQFRRPDLPRANRLNYRLVSAELEGERLTLQLETTVHVGSGAGDVRQIVGERYLLRLTPDGWRTVENRWWPVALRTSSQSSKFDAAAADAKVKQARDSGDRRQSAKALMNAYRFREAYELTKQLTGQDQPSADDWRLRARWALMVGDAQDAQYAFGKAADRAGDRRSELELSRTR